MPEPAAALTLAATDARWVLERGLERGGATLTAGELTLCRALERLPDEALATWVRLAHRTHPVQRATAAGPCLALLLERGLVTQLVPWSLRAERSTVAELRAGAASLGASTRGRRQELVERLATRRGWSTVRWIFVCHRELLARLERFAYLRPRPDPARPVIERLGHVRWPDYARDGAPALFADRAALRRWERVLACLDGPLPAEPEVPLAWLLRGDARGPGRLDLERALTRVVLEGARQLERDDEPARARAIYEAVQRYRPARDIHCALRIARTLEAEGRPRAALEILRARREVQGPQRAAVHRAGRRVARLARDGWAPDPPTPTVTERLIRLPTASPGHRPRFGAGEVVEPATIAALGALGRTALHAEGGLWRHLYGLVLCVDTYFAAVGQLPVRYLSGPLDVGTPGFAQRRAIRVEQVLHRVRRGEAPSLVTRAYAHLAGTRVAGVRWGDAAADAALADALGPTLLAGVLEVLLTRGWRAASGLPDLVVLPGPEVALPGALPSVLAPGLLLAELKTPRDTLSDAQRWWLTRLQSWAQTEVWLVQPVAADPHPP